MEQKNIFARIGQYFLDRLQKKPGNTVLLGVLICFFSGLISEAIPGLLLLFVIVCIFAQAKSGIEHHEGSVEFVQGSTNDKILHVERNSYDLPMEFVNSVEALNVPGVIKSTLLKLGAEIEPDLDELLECDEMPDVVRRYVEQSRSETSVDTNNVPFIDDIYDSEPYESVNFDINANRNSDVVIVNGKKTKMKKRKNPFEL